MKHLIFWSLCLTLAACGGDGNNSTNNDNNTQADTSNNENNTTDDMGQSEEDAGTDTTSTEDVAVDEGTEEDVALINECEPNTPMDCVSDSATNVCSELDSGQWVIEAVACGAGTLCGYGTCLDETQQTLVKHVELVVDEFRLFSGHARTNGYDSLEEMYDALQRNAVHRGLTFPDYERAIVEATTLFARELGHGHTQVYYGDFDSPSLCGDKYAYGAQTFYSGVCGAPSGDEVLVMSAPTGNSLGLNPGDRIVSTNKWAAGESFLNDVAQAPGCQSRVFGTVEGGQAIAAASFFGRIEVGDTLDVVAVDGTTRTITVPERDTEFEPLSDFCLDPFGGYNYVEAELTIRPDGVAVIRTSTLFPEPWADAEDYFVKVQEFIDRVGVAVAMVPDGMPIIWDIRGNSGGAAEVGIGIVAGMPGAQESGGYFFAAHQRIYETLPAQWYLEPNPDQSYQMGPLAALENPIYHGDHPTVVVIDGQTLSAADVMAYAVKHFSDATLVGPSGTAGAVGFGGFSAWTIPYTPEDLEVPTTVWLAMDPLKVVDRFGTTMDGTSIQPDVLVDYNPADVAAGIDTVLEKAVETAKGL